MLAFVTYRSPPLRPSEGGRGGTESSGRADEDGGESDAELHIQFDIG